MQTVGTGKDVALWFNARAKRVKPATIEAFRARLPEARCLVTHSLEQARTMARQLVVDPPRLLLCGGGDGTFVTLINLLHEEGAATFPPIGVLKLGTGNALAHETSAPSWKKSVERLPQLPLGSALRQFDLVDIEGRLTHFGGAGWDAIVLHDYRKNLERRKDQLLASRFSTRLHTSVFGYLYAIARITIPEQTAANARYGRTQVTAENLGDEAWTLDARQQLVRCPQGQSPLWKGHLSVAAVATVTQWGGGFKAHPHAHLKPGFLNVRFYDATPLHGGLSTPWLWRGAIGDKHMHDFFVKKARLNFSRPSDYQVGGDVMDEREAITVSVAPQTVQLLDWNAR